MTDSEMQSAVNMVRGWIARRVFKGKLVTRPDAVRHIRSLWSDLNDKEIAAIINKVFK